MGARVGEKTRKVSSTNQARASQQQQQRRGPAVASRFRRENVLALRYCTGGSRSGRPGPPPPGGRYGSNWGRGNAAAGGLHRGYLHQPLFISLASIDDRPRTDPGTIKARRRGAANWNELRSRDRRRRQLASGRSSLRSTRNSERQRSPKTCCRPKSRDEEEKRS